MIVKHKLFFAWSMHKEQKWLEEQAKKGLVLVDVGVGRYVFEEESPKDIVYQFDFQILSKKKEKEYLELFNDWVLIKRVGGWYYFRKEYKDGDTNSIFNDDESKNSLFRRLIGFLAITGFPLYYMLIIFLPMRTETELTFPSYYFFLRIVIIIFVILHAFAMLKILGVIYSYKKSLKE